MSKINDFNLEHWKEYDDVLTDSLWVIGEREKSGAHNNTYHGNFIPQIPNQLIRRFTKKGDVVLDAFLGSGTTLIESSRLGRHGIGIELVPEVADAARTYIGNELFVYGDVFSQVLVADSTTQTARDNVREVLEKLEKKYVQLIILHPPYHDIIKFSDDENDLCNTATVEDFTGKFGDVIENFADLLEQDRYLAIVIGDKYTKGEWFPLGFYLMQETRRRSQDLQLKSILVKNMVNNRAKRGQENLWRYRALAGGFYIFKHEYILLFKKSYDSTRFHR